MIDNLLLGLTHALSPEALFFCLLGVTIGTFIGVLPGVGSIAAISLALPLTFHMDPTVALIMLAGIFYGAQYGGSIASILVNIPGTSSAAVTCLDGYPMTRAGRGGVAIFATTISSFVGGSLAILALMAFAPTLAGFSLRFGSGEYFAIMVFALVAASGIGNDAPAKGLAMVLLGLLLGMIGTDVTTGQFRFTFGNMALMDGLSLVAMAVGLFGISEVLANLAGHPETRPQRQSFSLRAMLPDRGDWGRSVGPTLRGAATGIGLGVLPGSGPTIATFVAYAIERRLSRRPESFGQGAIEGVTAPESASNASVQAGFIPTLSLGIPGDPVMAILLGAMMIHGVTIGPRFITNEPEMFWALIASFWIGNVFLLLLNIPLIGIWVRLISMPYRVLYLFILFFVCIGVFAVRANLFDVGLALGFGVLGYVMAQLRYPAAPLLLGFVLGPLLEEHFRRGMLLADGSLLRMLEGPISLFFLAATALFVLVRLGGALRARRSGGPG